MSDTIIMYENGKAVGGEGHPTNADEITFDNTGTGLVSEEVESAIKEVNAKFDKGSVSVTADGVKTAVTLFAELFNMANIGNVTVNAILSIGKSRYRLAYSDSQQLRFGLISTSNGANIDVGAARLTSVSSGCHYCSAALTSSVDFHNNDTDIFNSGTVITLYY